MKKHELFVEFIRNLEYDSNSNKPVNKEAISMNFAMIHSKSKDPFTLYIISVAEFFEEHIVAYHTNTYSKAYSFKCSIKQCQMKIIFRSKFCHLFLNEVKSQLEHSEYVHLIDGHFKQKMTEETHNEFINMS